MVLPDIIEPSDLLSLQQDPFSNVVLVDATAGGNTYEIFKESHLVGAVFIDANKDLAKSTIEPSAGGRHPLPDIEDFSQALGRVGITPKSRVVVYDRQNGSNSAARFWWMLKSIGHQHIHVLNGGFQWAVKKGIALESGPCNAVAQLAYPAQEYKGKTVNLKDICCWSVSKDYLIVDVRQQARYLGDTEPIDLVAGHIPSAINIEFTKNLDEQGLFRSAEQLKELYQREFEKYPIQNIAFHCGSGITACHSLLALSYAGFELPALYVGSWSEYSRNPLPVATKQRY